MQTLARLPHCQPPSGPSPFLGSHFLVESESLRMLHSRHPDGRLDLHPRGRAPGGRGSNSAAASAAGSLYALDFHAQLLRAGGERLCDHPVPSAFLLGRNRQHPHSTALQPAPANHARRPFRLGPLAALPVSLARSIVGPALHRVGSVVEAFPQGTNACRDASRGVRSAVARSNICTSSVPGWLPKSTT